MCSTTSYLPRRTTRAARLLAGAEAISPSLRCRDPLDCLITGGRSQPRIDNLSPRSSRCRDGGEVAADRLMQAQFESIGNQSVTNRNLSDEGDGRQERRQVIEVQIMAGI